jgi:hypothetical protein
MAAWFQPAKWSSIALLALILAASPRWCAASGASSPAGAGLRPLTKTWIASETQAGAVGEWQIGGALRLRYIDLANVRALGLEPDRKHQVMGLRTQASASRRLSPTVRLVGRLVNESFKYVDCESCKGGIGEINVDNLYLEAAKPWGLPIGARLGRQDLFYGDGFVIADGTPLDESRTTYVNGILFTTAIPLWSLDFFMAVDPSREEYLPRINNKETPLSSTDDFVRGLLLSREPAPGTSLRYTLEPYYIYKRAKNEDRRERIHTVGARVGFALSRTEVAAEAAYQGGKAPTAGPFAGSQSISALGGHARLTAHPVPHLPLDLEAGYVYLTGDDPKTPNKYEGWNPVLGRWPMWSELYVYTLAVEQLMSPMPGGLAYWQNLKMPYFRIGYGRGGPVSFEAKYSWLDAFEGLIVDLWSDPSYEGPEHRGELYEFKMSWSLPHRFSGHLLYERFVPGDFYDVIEGFVPKDASYLRFEASSVF